MDTKHGTGASPGVAAGQAFVLESEGVRIPRRFVMPEEVPAEIQRFEDALGAARLEMERFYQGVAEKLGDDTDLPDIFRMHIALLMDPKLRTRITSLIRNRHFAAEHAVSQGLQPFARQLASAPDSYLSHRRMDIADLERWLLRALVGDRAEDLHHLREPVIVVAHDLTPAQTVGLDRTKTLAFVTDAGGRASHTAILARALGIPAVVGMGSFSREVAGGDTMIVDGARGVVILSPDDATLREYETIARQRASDDIRVTQEFCALPAVTKDGAAVAVYANIEFPNEAGEALAHGCEGIGLYRTEFLYHTIHAAPDEQAHLDAYRQTIGHMKDRPIIIRTLDLGADKFDTGLEERNPFLGCRSMRLMLRYPDVFRTQLRAILKASAAGNISLMLPMVTNLGELLEAKRIFAEVRAELDKRAVPYNRNIRFGIMIEVPSAAVVAERLAQEVDFFSIGTNDLIQYTLAVDRNNVSVSHLFNAADPSVLRLIKITLDAAARRGIPVSMCGEMAGDPLYTLLLVGLGLRSLSMSAIVVPQVKRIIRAATLAQAQAIAEGALALDTAAKVSEFLRDRTEQIVPGVL